MADKVINVALAANIQIPLLTMLGWWHSVNPHYDFVECLVRTAYELGPSQWEAADWVLAQVAVETGNGLSELCLTYKNFGGIGVSGDTDPAPPGKKPAIPKDGSNDWLWVSYKGKLQWVAGLSKPNVVEGVEMVIAHRKAFTDPNPDANRWALVRDPRYALARNNRIAQGWPVARTIDYFGNGRWAADPNYYPKIVEKFKQMQSWKGGK
jgi:hypothetical protein